VRPQPALRAYTGQNACEPCAWLSLRQSAHALIGIKVWAERQGGVYCYVRIADPPTLWRSVVSRCYGGCDCVPCASSSCCCRLAARGARIMLRMMRAVSSARVRRVLRCTPADSIPCYVNQSQCGLVYLSLLYPSSGCLVHIER
jgi:hypothetical protein